MYHPSVIERSVADAEKQLRWKLVRHDIGQIEERLADYAKLAQTRRPVSRDWRDFITNETILCALDFQYFSEHYAFIEKDGVEGGGVGRMKLWESQQIVLERVAKIQLECYEQARTGYPVDGIMLVINKSRQEGLTALARMMFMQRLNFGKHYHGMSISIGSKEIGELYDRDKLLWSSLPEFLRDEKLGYDVKDDHLYVTRSDGRMRYQESSQKSGLGIGKQNSLGHVTEASSLLYPDSLELDFFPTLPQSVRTLSILESTPQGRGNWWHSFSERVRKNKMGRWHYIFVPWYAEPKKYRRRAPDDWRPSEPSKLHAKRVIETSPEFMGKEIHLTRSQLYWYETTRQEYLDAGKLNLFLTNYSITPEESFQHTTRSAFDTQYLEKARLGASLPGTYEYLPAA